MDELRIASLLNEQVAKNKDQIARLLSINADVDRLGTIWCYFDVPTGGHQKHLVSALRSKGFKVISNRCGEDGMQIEVIATKRGRASIAATEEFTATLIRAALKAECEYLGWAVEY